MKRGFSLPLTWKKYFIPESDRSRLVFINGEYQEKYSSIGGLGNGVTVGNLSDHIDEPEVEEYSE